MGETRKLTAILVADAVGYSRLAGADEDGACARFRGRRSDVIDPAIAACHGRIVKRAGDGRIIAFRSVADAVRCAIEIQNRLIERNAGAPEAETAELREALRKAMKVYRELMSPCGRDPDGIDPQLTATLALMAALDTRLAGIETTLAKITSEMQGIVGQP
jgi:hypothetical protein